MRKILNIILILSLMVLTSCIKYSPNYRINKRTTPVIIIALDKENGSAVLIDGDDKTFTINGTPTSESFCASKMVGDTIRGGITYDGHLILTEIQIDVNEVEKADTTDLLEETSIVEIPDDF